MRAQYRAEKGFIIQLYGHLDGWEVLRRWSNHSDGLHVKRHLAGLNRDQRLNAHDLGIPNAGPVLADVQHMGSSLERKQLNARTREADYWILANGGIGGA